MFLNKVSLATQRLILKNQNGSEIEHVCPCTIIKLMGMNFLRTYQLLAYTYENRF